jgi:hypothetical protein
MRQEKQKIYDNCGLVQLPKSRTFEIHLSFFQISILKKKNCDCPLKRFFKKLEMPRPHLNPRKLKERMNLEESKDTLN